VLYRLRLTQDRQREEAKVRAILRMTLIGVCLLQLAMWAGTARADSIHAYGETGYCALDSYITKGANQQFVFPVVSGVIPHCFGVPLWYAAVGTYLYETTFSFDREVSRNTGIVFNNQGIEAWYGAGTSMNIYHSTADQTAIVNQKGVPYWLSTSRPFSCMIYPTSNSHNVWCWGLNDTLPRDF
jgi:hypothetical protein